jgi:hypothetical protein
MPSQTLSDPLSDLDRYLIHDGNEHAPAPTADSGGLEVEMRIRLHNGNQVAVTEHVDSVADLSGALDRARFRLAVSMARGVLDDAAPTQSFA